MSDVVSYEPSTETLRIGDREFDVLHLRGKSKVEVQRSVQIAMKELHGKRCEGAREIYRDTTIAIVPRPRARFVPPAELPNGIVIVTSSSAAPASWSSIMLFIMSGTFLVVGAAFWWFSG